MTARNSDLTLVGGFCAFGAFRGTSLDDSRCLGGNRCRAGIPMGDYNGRDRVGEDGVVSLLQTTTRDGRRASTYHAFLEGEAEERENLEVICHAHATRIVLEAGPDGLRATGVEYRNAAGEMAVVHAAKDVVVSAGAVGSPQLLLLAGIGPKDELEALGITCLLDAPDVGKPLQDHLQLGLVFPAPGVGVSMTEVGISMAGQGRSGPDVRTAGAGQGHDHQAGDSPSDDLIKDMARHYSLTVFHLTSTCRIGDVVDARLRVNGVAGLRVADASVMPYRAQRRSRCSAGRMAPAGMLRRHLQAQGAASVRRQTRTPCAFSVTGVWSFGGERQT